MKTEEDVRRFLRLEELMIETAKAFDLPLGPDEAARTVLQWMLGECPNPPAWDKLELLEEAMAQLKTQPKETR